MQIPQENCVSTKTLPLVSEKCNGRQNCSLEATSAALGGDTCPESTSNYLEVIYECVTGMYSHYLPDKQESIFLKQQ